MEIAPHLVLEEGVTEVSFLCAKEKHVIWSPVADSYDHSAGGDHPILPAQPNLGIRSRQHRRLEHFSPHCPAGHGPNLS